MQKSPPSVIRLVLGYINPAKYPFYIIILLGIVTLIIISKLGSINQERWIFLFVPIYFFMSLSLYLSFIDRINLKERETYEFEMKLSRTIGIVVPFICFIIAGELVLSNDKYLIVYIPCIIQTFVFMVYAYFAIKHGKEYFSKFNFIQLCMITTSLIVGITYTSENTINYMDKHTTAVLNHENKESKRIMYINSIEKVKTMVNDTVPGYCLYKDKKISSTEYKNFQNDSTAQEISTLIEEKEIENPEEYFSEYYYEHEEAYEAYKKNLRSKRKGTLSSKTKEMYDRHCYMLISLMVLWLICQMKWLHQLLKSIRIIMIDSDEHDNVFKKSNC